MFCQIRCLNLDDMTAGSLYSSIVLLLRDEGEERLFLRSKYANCLEGAGGFNLCPNVFGALSYGALYLVKMPNGVGVKALPNDLDHLNGFILLNSIKIYFFYLAKWPKMVGGLGRVKNIRVLFLDFLPLEIFF